MDSHGDSVHYEVFSITSNPGIYYERLPSIRIQKGSWKVIIHLDLHAFLKEHGRTRSYDEQLSQCTAHFDAKHCQAALNQDLIEKSNLGRSSMCTMTSEE